MPSRQPRPDRATLATRLARRAAAALLLAAAPLARADAQAACTTATAAAYTADGFACRIGSWRLYDFHVGTDHSAVGGAAGDMTLASLVAAGAPLEEITGSLRRLDVPFELSTESTEINGVGALRVSVRSPQERAHRDFAAIRTLVPDGVEGAIIGSALYRRAFTLPEALDTAGRP